VCVSQGGQAHQGTNSFPHPSTTVLCASRGAPGPGRTSKVRRVLAGLTLMPKSGKPAAPDSIKSRYENLARQCMFWRERSTSKHRDQEMRVGPRVWQAEHSLHESMPRTPAGRTITRIP